MGIETMSRYWRNTHDRVVRLDQSLSYVQREIAVLIEKIENITTTNGVQEHDWCTSHDTRGKHASKIIISKDG